MEKKENNFQKGEIVIYKSPKSGIEVEVRFERENVWLRQDEIARLYNKERSVITKHINNIFKDKEVDKKSNVQKLHIAGSDKPVAFYSLDVILAVGYRTNSAKAIQISFPVRTGSSERYNFKERSFWQDIPVLPFQNQAGIFYQAGKRVEVSISRNLQIYHFS